MPRLRDPDFTRVLIVTLPEATPVHEAAALQQDLAGGHQPFAWVINQSLSPLPVTDAVLKSRKLHERVFIREVTEELSPRTGPGSLAGRRGRAHVDAGAHESPGLEAVR